LTNKKQIDLKVSEICCHVPELACLRYKEVIGEIYSCLIKHNVYLRVVKEHCDRSYTQWNYHNSMLEPLGIELCVGNYSGKSVLWDLVHELGHLLFFDFGKEVPESIPWWLMPPKRCAENEKEAQLQLDDEEKAWNIAEEWLNRKFSLRKDESDDFNSHRKSCLATYKAKVKYFENR
jgi:hypothetical protein